MTYVEWDNNVNTRFFEFVEGYQENSVSTEYSSGRKVTYLKNTKFAKTYTCKLSLNVKTGEYQAFKNWYENILMGTVGIFKCSVIGNKCYRFSTVPVFDNGRIFKTCELEIEEV